MPHIPQPQSKFIDFSQMPLDVVMVIETAAGTAYEVQRAEDGGYIVTGGAFEDDALHTFNPPRIDGFGKPARLGPLTTAPVAGIAFEPLYEDDGDDGERQPQPVATTRSFGATVGNVIFVNFDSPAASADQLVALLAGAQGQRKGAMSA